ncbi:Ank domain-containing protein/Ank_2 domain-containing protein/Ank_4 domain-containing protein/zf-C3HC4_3 domain-containing protein [Cephalotus follicularis]|uniref:RING-type E3 ubiquitin transferase n=1 Tax=Cephalotus follicularis TaxID=3775 RepID=A0A1Q3BP36_CEPFO|nr:Ank domain-containing protein/Ank_2 domain-containing protein/Ank_4 domain-containing protein/zf-C3HC4_3 domain-containing protein [Cephalotus follicularis]
MGQGLSCRELQDNALFSAVRNGDLDMVETMVEAKPSVLEKTTGYGRNSPLHVASMYGQMEVLSMLLDRFKNPDILNRHKQTPLMLAAMHGKISCVKKLIQAGAFIIMFDSLNGRTCLHLAADNGHSDCLHALLSAAHTSPVADSWGFARFVNIRDESGSTPLHLAARQGWSDCVHMLLDNGALVSASTGGNGYPGSTPLHFAARGGSIDCIRELLAWGADRHQPDAFGRLPYTISLRHKHEACSALLNPSSAEPLVWPLPLRFIRDLNPEAKALIERALVEANKEWEKGILKETNCTPPSPLHSDAQADDSSSESADVELCCICFDQLRTIEIRQCGHLMCAHCILALCCHKKPHPITAFPTAPVCPFCRSKITELVVAKITNNDRELDISPSRPRRSRKSNFSEGSSSFKSLSAMGSFGKASVRSSGKIASECNGDNKQ